jgi:hypothetical protein
MDKALKAGLRKQKLEWKLELEKRGLRLQGYEVRGWRRLAADGQHGIGSGGHAEGVSDDGYN